MTGGPDRRRRSSLLRVGVSLGLLLGVGWLLGAGDVVARLARFRAEWVAAGLTVSVLQVAASAWRWRFTAGRLGIDLRLGAAWREYYLATFLNQVLPGGVAGDLSRAWRQASQQTRLQAPAGSAVRAVILERASGQLAMLLVALLSVAILPVALPALSRLVIIGIAIACAALVVAAVVRARRLASARGLAGRVWRDTRAALLTGAALPIQLASSLLIVGSYVAMYLMAARAVGIDTSWLTLAPLVAPVLMTMLVPVTVAGWGLREGAAASLWGLAGLTPADGVAISVAYGVLVLVSSSPGALVLLLDPERGASSGL
jgi:uncharacterized membrane protein YbhN (UPF0104 family)